MTSTLTRSHIHYTIALALFSLYGIQVCPFLDSLTTAELFVPIFLGFSAIALLRTLAEPRLTAMPVKRQVRGQFSLDLALFLLVAVVLGAYNRWVYDFLWESGGKILVGMTVLGFMIACDAALAREYQLAQQLRKSGQQIDPDLNPFPLTRKFHLFSLLCLASIVGVVFLVINKDLEWLIETGDSIPLQTSQRYILTEIAFIAAIIMGYTWAVIAGYTRNLRFFINEQHQVLSAVGRGQLDAQVAVVSNDEFGQIAQRTNQMIKALAHQTQELQLTRDASILGLASLAETRDNETGGHILRTQYYVKVLAEQLATHSEYQQYLTPQTIDQLYKSAPLHDVGKVGIPDNILLKPGKLTDEEFAIMKSHAQIGADALAVAERQLGSHSFLTFAREISLTHHEKWDGSGYPNGLKGKQIPLSGQLMALADVYDALISKRVYKPAMSHREAKAIILQGREKHFSPDVVDAFLECEQGFIDIAAEYSDERLQLEAEQH